MSFSRAWVVAVVGAASLSTILASCVGDDPAPNTDTSGDGGSNTPDGGGGGGNDGGGGGGDASNAASFTMTPPRPRVVRGASIDVEVKIDRKQLTGDVAITLTGLPTGVTATAASIPAAGATVTITLTAAANAQMGAAPITVAAAGVDDLATDVVVAGKPGQSDESFDGDGFLLDTAVATASYQAVLTQPDGKILAAGTTNAVGGAWMVKRFHKDGAPDTAFDTAAAAALPKTGAARAIVVDGASGKIVVVGGSGATLEQLTIVRLNPTGAPDQAFASAGTMVADTVSHGQGSRGNAVVVLADSTVIVAGKNGPRGLVEAYSAAGLPHPTFLRYQTTGDAELFGLAALTGGSYLATGTDITASPDAQLAVRLLSNGTPDAAFGGAAGRGYASGCRGYGLAIATNGDALIVGDDQTAPVLCATRIAGSGNGNLAWTVKSGAGSNGQFLAAATAAADATYSVGHGGGSVDRYATIERRLADGGLDPAFGTTGEVQFEDLAGTPDTFRYVIRAAKPAPDGRLLVAGSRTGAVSPGAFVARIWE